MTEQKDNYVPAWDSLRRYGSTRLTAGGSTGLTTGGSLLVPSRPASEGDEDVLASIARRHALSMGIRRQDLIPPDAPSTADEGELPVVSPSTLLSSTVLGTGGTGCSTLLTTGETESPLPDSTGLREAGPKGVFYVRRAICKSPGEPARGEPAVGRFARSRFARGRLARVLIVYLVSIVVLTVALCFGTWIDEQRNEEFAQTSILVDGGRDSPKTEDPEAETLGRRNTVIVVDR